MSTRKAILLSLLTGCALSSYPHAHAFTDIKANNPVNAAAQYQHILHAATPIDAGAKDFVEKLANDGIGFLSDDSLSVDQRKVKFKKFLIKNFDMKTIGRFALGRYWKSTSQKEQKEYLTLFEQMIVEVYSKRFSEYNGQSLEVLTARPEGKKDAIVSSVIVPDSGPKVRVDWRVRYKNNSYRVIDIIVEGVSMALTQRSDFASVIQRGGGKVEVLLAHLRVEDQ